MNYPFRSVEVFWHENSELIFAYGAYSLVVCGVILLIEYRNQQSDIFFYKLFFSNIAYFLFTMVLFISSMFIYGWLPELFGNDVTTGWITALISIALLFVFKRFLNRYLELRFNSPQLIFALAPLFLLAPYVTFLVYVNALGSSWTI